MQDLALWWAALRPPYEWLWPAQFAVMLYGVRYVLMAVLVFAFARPTRGTTHRTGWGRLHANAPTAFNYRRHVLRELGYSAMTVLVFGGVNAVLFGWGLFEHSLMYYDLADYPVWWFVLSIGVMLVIHDALFYWMHRAMHWRGLFSTMHRVHHQSVHPTTFAAYSFHPTEALAQALMVTAIIYMVPVHPLAFLIFQTFSTAYNVYGHCGREFYPSDMATHRWGRWINTSTAHALHHASGHGNYGLYFLWWDRWFKTYRPS